MIALLRFNCKIYVTGQTKNELKLRWGTHKCIMESLARGESTYKDYKDWPLYSHPCFLEDVHNVEIFGFDQMPEGFRNKDQLDHRESYWIRDLRVIEEGLNFRP